MSKVDRAPVPDRPWPAHPIPVKGESLISWLYRIAGANGISFHDLLKVGWEGKRVWQLALDRSIPEWVLEVLVTKTRQSPEALRALTLEGLDDHLNSQGLPGRMRWALPEAEGGQQCCPICLDEHGKTPHFRLKWRLAFVNTCTKHGIQLIDSCPSCGHPIDLTSPRPDPANHWLTVCGKCGMDFRDIPKGELKVAKRETHLDRLSIKLQGRMEEALEAGCMDIKGHGMTYSRLAFDGIHQITKMLGAKASADKLNQAITGVLGRHAVPLPVSQWPKGRSFEFLPAATRAELLGFTAWLMEEWPIRFIRVCKQARVWSNCIHQDRRGETPYWLAKVADGELKVEYAQWRDPATGKQKRSVDSYARLAKRVQSARLGDLARKIEFIRRNSNLTSDLDALALAMRDAGFYSAGTQRSNILPGLPKLVSMANDPAALTNIHGIPFIPAVKDLDYNHPRGRAFMSIEEEGRLMEAFWEGERNGIPITAREVRRAISDHTGKSITESAVYRFLMRHGWKPKPKLGKVA
ncbi:MAG: TniQ family protein [Acidobacteria bacterium]|nr:TniQ family protein [Acidobacteriota bacterium]